MHSEQKRGVASQSMIVGSGFSSYEPVVGMPKAKVGTPSTIQLRRVSGCHEPTFAVVATGERHRVVTHLTVAVIRRLAGLAGVR